VSGRTGAFVCLFICLCESNIIIKEDEKNRKTRRRNYEVYKVTAMRMVLYIYTSWAEKVRTSIRNQNFKTRNESKILDRRDFCRIHAISRRILLVKLNNSCSAFLTKF